MGARSMTGFGTATFTVGGQSYDLQLKAVNHKSLNLRLRLPPELGAVEISARKRVQAALGRGAVDLSVNRGDAMPTARKVVIDQDEAAQVMTALKALATHLGAPAPTLELAVRVGDFISMESPSVDEEERVAAFAGGLDAAIAALVRLREQEGAALQEDIEARLDVLSGVVEQVAAIVPEVQAKYEEKLRARLAELREKGGVDVDESRLATELVLFSDKCDVTEEVVRARAHLVRFREILSSDAAELGKRLDFLSQELNREFNTMGSKGRDVGVAEAVVNAKVELEKIREQVQNIL